MSDVSSFIRRGHNNSETINKLQALITPLAFADPEDDALKERIILASPKRLRTITAFTGLDSTRLGSEIRKRTSSSLTILPDTATPSAFPVSPSIVGTLDFDIAKKYGAGARFNGTQYISIPDDNQFDLTLPYFTMAFWFKSTNGGTQTIYNKSNFNFDQDFCSVCADFSDDYSTDPDTTTEPDRVKLEFWDSTLAWENGTQALELINCDSDQEGSSYTNIYTSGSGNGQWYRDAGDIYFNVFSGAALWELKETKVHNFMDIVKKPDAQDEVRQISFPKHFFFFTSVLKSIGGFLGRIQGLFPTINDSWLFHLKYGNVENSQIKDNTINIDDTEDTTGVIHKEVAYNIQDRSISIKQQELS